jgi:mono/diheme cytochrome c family protein/transposase-like protein
MHDGSQSVYVRRLKLILLISSLVSLVLLLMSAYQENLGRAWRHYQKSYRATLIAQAPDQTAHQAAERIELQIQQAFLPELRRIDRCVTCHIGIDNPTQTQAPQPLRVHSGTILTHHPVDQFGCTVCHDGQGRAIDQQAAHGEEEHWPSPLLRGEAVYTSCGRCHYENDLFGAEYDLYTRGGPLQPLNVAELNASVPGVADPAERAIGRGKELVLASGCLGCHKFRERGGVLGPDITYVGDKSPHDFDFTHIEGEHTVAQWLFEHFKKPGEVAPGTLMPDMGLADAQARDLMQYMLSLHRKSMPAAYTPVPPRRPARPVSGERLFAMFCSACHGQHGQGRTAPDLTLSMLAEPPRQLLAPVLNNSDTLAVASDDFLRRIITTGRHDTNMPSWHADEGGLSAAEINRLVGYIRTWQTPGAALQSIRAWRGDPRRGRVLYRGLCQSCHGRNGKGGIGVSLNSPSFLAVASDDFLARAIVYGRANTAMPAWKHLTAEQVSDLLAYIRSWQQQPPEQQAVLAKLAAGPPSRQALRIGHALYRANCATCHGGNGEGGIGPSLKHDAFLSIVDNEYLFNAIVLGRPGTAMPAWKHLSTNDLVDLINYIRSWNRRQRRELEPYLARGDGERGQILFQGMCAACHGKHAEGATGPQLNNPVFLASADDAMLREWVRFGKPGTEMRAFAKGQQGMVELSASQIEDVVTFLRRLQIDGRTVSARPGMGIIASGAEIYASVCAQCHGRHGEGITGSALANADFLRAASDGFLQATIVLGRDGTGMRAMGRGGQGNVELSVEDVNNLVAFIRSWERRPPTQTIPARYVLSADIVEGRTLYAGYCAGCHGKRGNDGWAPALNNGDFLSAATDGFLQATIARGRAGTPMRPFGAGSGGVAELSSDQINNIVAFLRTWAPEGYRPGKTVGGKRVSAAQRQQAARLTK